MIKSQATSDFMGHPRGLFYLFFAELWERFSFYGMRALLVLYMTKELLFNDSMSFGIFAAYMSLVYLTPIMGGMLADKYLGYRKSIMLGGVFMALGHFFLTISHPIFFFGSLALIIVGNGFFKPNISSFVGTLYEKSDPRRDSGFTIFYMGINIGGAVAPLLCAWIAELYGWHFGFTLAGIGMLTGLFYFHRGIKKGVFLDHGHIPDRKIYDNQFLGLNKGQLITAVAILFIPIFALIIKFNQYEHYLVWLASAVILFILARIYRSVDVVAKGRLLVSTYFTILMTLFWAIFEQAGSSLTLFADRNVELIGINAAQTNSINGGFIILLAIPFSMLWAYLHRINKNPNSATKSGIGLILLGCGFLIFAFSANWADAMAQTPMLYLVVGYFVLTVGELFISPIGLSKMTQLAPLKYLAFIMGVFFTSSFYGHFFAGKIAKLTSVDKDASQSLFSGYFDSIIHMVTGMSQSSIQNLDSGFIQLYSYTSVYAVFGFLTILIGFISICISPWIKKLMHGIK